MKPARISLPSALKDSVPEIENTLKLDIIGAERVIKIYGSNANSFVLKTIREDGKIQQFFLKFCRNDRVQNELKGQRLIENLLPTPKVILASKRKFLGHEWALYEYMDGELIIEKIIKNEFNKNHEEIFNIEQEKEDLLKNIHSTQRTINFKEYFNLRANLLFHKRINGKRYQQFFDTSPTNISRNFPSRIRLNNHYLPLTIQEIISEIRKKYKSPNLGNIPAILGQGDAHHGNIIVNQKIWFIDNEYAGYLPPFMEFSKPYYNDFIGSYFFHYNKVLKKYFKVESCEESPGKLKIKIKVPKRLDLRLKITQVKINSRTGTANKNSKDFLSLNDYLVMCHTLTKDPNKYSAEAQLIFLVFTIILYLFDPFDPESIYRYF